MHRSHALHVGLRYNDRRASIRREMSLSRIVEAAQPEPIHRGVEQPGDAVEDEVALDPPSAG
jgi:hypothetical protein